MKRCLILRAEKSTPGEEDPYAKALRDANYQPHFVPALQFDYTNIHEVVNHLHHPETFSGLILTSQNSVEAITLAVKSEAGSNLLTLWKSLPVFVVGKATAKAVNQLGLSVEGEISGKANNLADIIIKYYSNVDKAQLKPLLFPCGNLKREELPTLLNSAGIPLHTVTCYQTMPHSNCAKNVREIATLGSPDWIVFFSPSGVQYSIEALMTAIPSLKDTVKVAAIGPTTAEAARSSGLPVNAVAKSPTPSSLLEAIQHCDTL
ncbi:uroporphyrinogen-III synthase-like [Dysidea avara]|uniref:uroporphyrinogen-III synthase-like n=1 Tax=Dysidea avara TaxID=196820 RepID=UPI00332F3303